MRTLFYFKFVCFYRLRYLITINSVSQWVYYLKQPKLPQPKGSYCFSLSADQCLYSVPKCSWSRNSVVIRTNKDYKAEQKSWKSSGMTSLQIKYFFAQNLALAFLFSGSSGINNNNNNINNNNNRSKHIKADDASRSRWRMWILKQEIVHNKGIRFSGKTHGFFRLRTCIGRHHHHHHRCREDTRVISASANHRHRMWVRINFVNIDTKLN